ncbi:MAG: alpha/beta hydrolase family protein [Myxococcales bacterium]|nr:alpha/beta hydrolase family protein [Myxococcales bacterium]MCB9644474.1 alpha/beta hydrolase family protein [Myxococcales bacterium]
MWRPFTTGVEQVTSWFVNRVLIKQSERQLDLSALRAYFDEFPVEAPQTFFAQGDITPPEKGWMVQKGRRGEGIEAEFSFLSALPSGDFTNDRVRGVSLLHPDYRRGAHVVLLHGWITPGHQQSMWVARELLRYGISTHMIELPYHMRRAPRGYFSGTRVIDADLSVLFDALRQGVADTRKLLAGLRAEGFHRLGLLGISLGGYTAGLVSSLEQELESLTLAAPLVDLGYTLLNSPMIESGRRMIAHLPQEELMPLFELFRLSRYQPLLERERILLINSMHDQVVYPHKVQELWQAWDQPMMFKESHGHVTFFFSRDSFQKIAEYIGHPRAQRPSLGISQTQPSLSAFVP